MITNTKKGFTLIEILIVVAIIAILASVVLVGLGPTQRAGRDARRLSDLHQVQNALELYFNRCGYYPGTATCASNAAPAAGAAGYTNMSSALTGTASIGTPNIPVDPTNSGSLVYQYGATPAAAANQYTLAAQLEDVNNSALSSSITGSSNGITGCGTTGLYCLSL